MTDKNGNPTGAIMIQRGVGTISWDYVPDAPFVVDKAPAGKKPRLKEYRFLGAFLSVDWVDSEILYRF